MIIYPDGSTDSKESKAVPWATPEQIQWTNHFKKLERKAIKEGKDIPWNKLSEKVTKELGYGVNYIQEEGAPGTMQFKLHKAGKVAALQKLGLQLSFDDPSAARKHYQRRGAIEDVAGFAGSIPGGTLGGAAGAAGGAATPIPGGAGIGMVGGSLAGAELGGRLAAIPATLAYDVAHDIPQRFKETARGTAARLGASAGLPSGMTNSPTGGM